MDQGVPGSQSEPFYELLHPSTGSSSMPMDSPPAASTIDPSPPSSPPPPPPPLVTQRSYGDSEGGIIPSYDFIPSGTGKSGDAGARSDEQLPAEGPSAAANYHHHHHVPTMGVPQFQEVAGVYKDEPERLSLTAVEQAMKKYSDNLLHVLEGMSGRLTQIENTVQSLEHAIEGLQIAGVEKHNHTNGRLTRLEYLIKEVQMGVQLLHDKEGAVDARSQLTNPQAANNQGYLPGPVNTASADGWKKHEGEGPHYPMPSQAPPQLVPQAPHHPHAPAPQPQILAPQQRPLSPQLSATESSIAPHQQTPPPPPQHAAPSSNLASSHSTQAPPFYSQSPQQPPPSSYNLPQAQVTTQYGSHYPPPPSLPPGSSYVPELPQYFEGPRASQALHASQEHAVGGPQQVYEPVVGRMGSSHIPLYQPPQSSPPASNMYDTSSGGYGSPAYRVAQPAVPSAPSGGGGYPRLPMAQPLPHSFPASMVQPLPHALPASSGPSSRTPPSANRVSVDEVIEKVANMGFPKEHVRAVVRRLTENGQSVDLNVVLDKLMNGGEFQPPRGWFGR